MNRWALRMGCAVLVAVGALYGLHKVNKAFFAVHAVRYLFDDRLTFCAQDLIQTHVEEKCAQQLPVSEIATSLCAAYPWIQTVTLEYHAPHQITLAVTPSSVVCTINQDRLLLADGRFVFRYLFEPTAYKHVRSITVDKPMLDCSDTGELVQRALHQIPQDVFAFYTVSFTAPNTVIFRDKHHTQFHIVGRAEAPPAHTYFAWCRKIKSNLAQRGQLRSQGAKNWVADVRFADQIVVSGGRGDGYYGTSIC